MKASKTRASLPLAPTESQLAAAYTILSNQTDLTQRRSYQVLKEIYASFLETAPEPYNGGLSTNQLELMRFIQDYIDENTHSPSYQDIVNGITRITNKGNVHHYLKSLETKGFLCMGYGARSVRILIRV